MKLPRMSYETGAVLEFYEDGLTALGALCDRPWHSRLEVAAEGRVATLWNSTGELYAGDLEFTGLDATGPRDAMREVFPGCPLTFRLAEMLRPSSLPLERVLLAHDAHLRPPDLEVAEKRWRSQFDDTRRWRATAPFLPAVHFSLVVLARCEIQAIDQHWALHRLAVSLPDGGLDASLAREIGFAQVNPEPSSTMAWPAADPAQWSGLLERALAKELTEELAGIRTRQEERLRRELERVDVYFENYSAELMARARRSAPARLADRLAATKAEHARHRADQVARHEICVYPHLDALLLVAEPAWRALLQVERAQHPPVAAACFVPRARRWVLTDAPTGQADPAMQSEGARKI